ncbi:MAG: class A beta-lactamase-related serine hydrolase [Iphinoe sp. HA4291-MV1]|nr:class A beta-lactamase-related serine hydrolase [Iphinoe sp. HA4291-MV1]
MRKWSIKVFLNQLSRLRLVSKVNTVTVTLTIVSVLLTTLITKSHVEQSARPSTKQALNLPTTPPVLPVQVFATSSPKRAFNSPTTPVVLPDWAITKSLPIPSRQVRQEDSEVVYNLKTPPKFRQTQELQAIVNDVVNLTAAKGLPKKALSITLIDAKTGVTAGYQQDTPRYPASVVKLFWMVILYAQIESGIWKNEKDFTPYLAKMIKESDNEAASFIIDQVTGTHSEPELESEKFKIWKNKRQQVNRFFQQAGYKPINISQKTFPIDYLNLPEPKGSELQLLSNPISNWNKITTKQGARLLYEVCYAGQAVSAQASKKMCGWLKRDLNPKVWQKEPLDSDGFNPVQTFFGESLSDTDVQLYSKAGWVSLSRAETAMITTENSGATYILAIFAEDSAYADDTQIFPQMSRLIYNRMTSRNLKSLSKTKIVTK